MKFEKKVVVTLEREERLALMKAVDVLDTLVETDLMEDFEGEVVVDFLGRVTPLDTAFEALLALRKLTGE